MPLARLRPCLVCRTPTTGPRCPDHARDHDRARREVYDSPAYRKLRARVIGSWLRERGPWCPGYDVPAHVSHRLTLDHVIPLEHGGAPLDVRNAGVLCRACNARKQART